MRSFSMSSQPKVHRYLAVDNDKGIPFVLLELDKLVARVALSLLGPCRRGFGRSSVGQVLELLDGVL